MPLVPYEPFRHLEQMRRELDHFWNSDHSLLKGLSSGFGHLHTDVYETGSEVVVTCDIPGLEKKEDVHIDVDSQRLSISGSIQHSREVKEEQMHRQERFAGRFHRSVSLPAPVSPEGVKATYKNGVLEIRMQKQQDDQRRRIDVQFH